MLDVYLMSQQVYDLGSDIKIQKSLVGQITSVLTLILNMNQIDSNDNSDYESAYLYKRSSDTQLQSSDIQYESNPVSQYTSNFVSASADTSFEVSRDSIKQKFLARALQRTGQPSIAQQRTASTGAVRDRQAQRGEKMGSPLRPNEPPTNVNKSMDDIVPEKENIV